MTKPFVIIGAGQAGAQAVASLRQAGAQEPIVLIGDEPWLPYQRPPLSKKFMAGELPTERLFLKPEAFYDQAGVKRLQGVKADAIDRAAKEVVLQDGTRIAYGKLLLATGSCVRTLPVPGADLPGIHALRTIADVEGIRAHFKPGARLVVVGGGYIGLEVAAVAVKAGIVVTVVEMADRILSRVTSPAVSDFYQGVHAEAGVNVQLGVQVARFEGDGRLERVVGTGGEVFPADFAVVGVGVAPVSELAEKAGLACQNGIVVDEHARTQDEDIFAAGDCTNFPSGLYGTRLRLESVHNAIEQAKAAAFGMAGKPVVYDDVPWFWSDQYDLKLQIAGLWNTHDRMVLRGDPKSRSFAVFYLKDGALIAVDAINAAPEYMVGRKLIAARAKIPPEKLSDTGVSMKELGQAHA